MATPVLPTMRTPPIQKQATSIHPPTPPQPVVSPNRATIPAMKKPSFTPNPQQVPSTPPTPLIPKPIDQPPIKQNQLNESKHSTNKSYVIQDFTSKTPSSPPQVPARTELAQSKPNSVSFKNITNLSPSLSPPKETLTESVSMPSIKDRISLFNHTINQLYSEPNASTIHDQFNKNNITQLATVISNETTHCHPTKNSPSETIQESPPTPPAYSIPNDTINQTHVQPLSDLTQRQQAIESTILKKYNLNKETPSPSYSETERAWNGYSESKEEIVAPQPSFSTLTSEISNQQQTTTDQQHDVLPFLSQLIDSEKKYIEQLYYYMEQYMIPLYVYLSLQSCIELEF